MRTLRGILLLTIFTPVAIAARADLAAIQTEKLPQETPVLNALNDVRQLEPYCESWTSTWSYPVSKSDAAARLKKDLVALEQASASHPDNEELLVLTGVVASYAYNVDVDGSYDAATDALKKAANLAPTDLRAPWYQAALTCGSSNVAEGGAEFLAIEAAHAWDQLPVEFWDDYMFCASVSNMPAHLLRAADYAARLHASDSQMRDFLVSVARKRFDVFDPNEKYAPKEVWAGENEGNDTQFTSTMCGVRIRVHGDWKIEQLELNNGVCLAYFSTGPYKATVDSLHPSVVLMVQRPKEGESLADFSKRFMTDGAFTPDTEARCPVDHCLAFKAEQPGMYHADGDGHGRILFFEREEPAYPGLIFESPEGPPVTSGSSEPQYFRPSQIEKRIPGKLYYLVMLDAAASIEEPAVKDYDFFLENLTVE